MGQARRKTRTTAVRWRSARIPIDLGFAREYLDGWKAKIGSVELQVLKSPTKTGYVYGWTAFDTDDGRDRGGTVTTPAGARAHAEKAAAKMLRL